MLLVRDHDDSGSAAACLQTKNLSCYLQTFATSNAIVAVTGVSEALHPGPVQLDYAVNKQPKKYGAAGTAVWRGEGLKIQGLERPSENCGHLLSLCSRAVSTMRSAVRRWMLASLASTEDGRHKACWMRRL